MSPQEAWSNKDERQYKKVKQSLRKEGKESSRAREIAARVVNRTRREEGRTARKTTSGTGNPNSTLETRTKQELYNRARELGISGRSNMNKKQLIDAIRSRK